MLFQTGDIVSLKSYAEMKMTVRETQGSNVVCDWFNVDKTTGMANMQRETFLAEQLQKINAENA